MYPSRESPGWWQDEWGAWHGPPEDLSNTAPHEARPARLPPHLRPAVPAPFRAAFDSEVVSGATPSPSEAPRAVADLHRPPDAESEGALRGLMAFLRSLLPDEEEPKP